MRGKLIALLKGNLPNHSNEVAYWSDEHIGALADHLISNGVVVREKGEWISHEGYEECRSCHAKAMFPHNFCPNCGADMRKGENG